MTTTSLFFGPKALTPIFVFLLQFGTTPIRGAVAVGLQQNHRRIPAALLPSGVVVPDTGALVLNVEPAPAVMKRLKEKRHLMKIVTVLDDLLLSLGESLKLFRVGHFLSAYRRSPEFILPFRIGSGVAFLRSFAESLLRFHVTPVTDRVFNTEEVVSGQILNLQGPERGAVKAPVISMRRDCKKQHEGGDNGHE